MKHRIFKDLASYLAQSGETQQAFAARLGLSQGYISQIRQGKRVPSLGIAQRIAEAARIPIESLVAGSDRV